MNTKITGQTTKLLMSYQQPELTDHVIYSRMACREKDPQNRAVLEQIAADETGHAAIIEDNDESLAAFSALVEKYSGDQPKESNQEVIGRCMRACLVAIDVEHITGKQAAEDVKA